jgi:hypothetical protein
VLLAVLRAGYGMLYCCSASIIRLTLQGPKFPTLEKGPSALIVVHFNLRDSTRLACVQADVIG